jgi:tRNA modification GTPase
VVFGRFQLPSGATEELVVGVVSAEEVEVHCHGGRAAAEAILAALEAAGCRVETWREQIEAAEADPIAATALIALAEARTERTAAILLDQYHGALRRELEQIRDLIPSDSPQANAGLALLLRRGDLGRHLTRPWRVVLTGAPNVGKSSLINALLGYQRAIVFDEPGTTRDVLTATTAIDGWPVELADTAGLRTGGDAIEAEGVARALRLISEGDLVIEVWDEAIDRESARHEPRLLLVHNKCDLWLASNQVLRTGLCVSAKTGQGIDELCGAIAERLVPHPPPPGAAVPFTELQIDSVRGAQTALEQDQPEGARLAIDLLL